MARAPSTREEVLALPHVTVPPGAIMITQATLHYHFKAKRLAIYADDATKLRVQLGFGPSIGGTSHQNAQLPAGMFSDGPVNDLRAFIIHCSECGAPVEPGASRCRYCNAPFTWRITETAYGMAGLALDFPCLAPGHVISATFYSRASVAIDVDAAFIGESL